MGKGWSVFFGVVLFGTFIIWFVAPFYNWWLPDNIATFGGDVDNLFYLIFVFVGFFFVLTEMVLVYAMWQYAARPGEKAVYTHGNHRLEMVWTAIPAAILLFIAPWVMDYSSFNGAAWTSWIVGVLTVVVAVAALPQVTARMHTAH